MVYVAYATGGGLSRELLRRTAIPGVLFAMSFITGFASIKMTSIANATLITTIQPVLVVFIAPRLFGERLTPRQLGYSFLSLAGVLMVVVLPFGALTSNDLGHMTTKDWLCAVGMTLGPGLLGHGLMTWSQSYVDVTIASLLGLMSPVVSTALALVFLGEVLTPWQLLGAVVVLSSLALLVANQRGSTPKVSLEVSE